MQIRVKSSVAEGRSISVMINEDERQEYEDRIQLLTQENDLLYQKNENLEAENADIKEVLSQRTEDGDKYQSLYTQSSQELVQFKSFCERLKMAKDLCEQKLKEFNEKSSSFERQCEHLRTEN